MKNNNVEEIKRESEIDLVKKGCLMASYGRTYFCTIYSALGIGKFRFSIVKLDTNGKDSVEIYLSSGEVKRLVDDVIRGTFFKKIEQEDSQYPSTYKFVKGTNGCYSMNIGKSTISDCFGFQIGSQKENSKKQMMLTPVAENDIRDFAIRYYVCVCGLLPTPAGFSEVPANSYYAQLQKVFWESEKDKKKYFEEAPSSARPEKTASSASNPKNNAEKPNAADTNKKNNKTSEAKNQNAGNTASETKTSKPSIKVQSTSTLNRNEDGSYRMQAVKESDGTIINILIPADAVAAMGESTFSKFMDKVNSEGSTFSFTGKKRHQNDEDVYIFAEFVK